MTHSTLPFLLLNRDDDSVLFEMILRKLKKGHVVHIRSPNLQFKFKLKVAHYGNLLFLRSTLHYLTNYLTASSVIQTIQYRMVG